jgi:hypothetical protein
MKNAYKRRGHSALPFSYAPLGNSFKNISLVGNQWFDLTFRAYLEKRKAILPKFAQIDDAEGKRAIARSAIPLI